MNQELKDILDAIQSVKSRARAALDSGNMPEHAERMFDLIALQSLLVGAVIRCQKALDEERKRA